MQFKDFLGFFNRQTEIYEYLNASLFPLILDEGKPQSLCASEPSQHHQFVSRGQNGNKPNVHTSAIMFVEMLGL